MRFQEGEIPAVPLGWWAGREQERSRMEVGAGFPGLPLHEPGLSLGAWAERGPRSCLAGPLACEIWGQEPMSRGGGLFLDCESK